MVCEISTDKLEYKIGETVEITYDGDFGSLYDIHFLLYPAGPDGERWTVRDLNPVGPEKLHYTLKDTDTPGTWELGMLKVDAPGECSILKYVTVEAALGYYTNRCGDVPTYDNSRSYTTAWWDCALKAAFEDRGKCHDENCEDFIGKVVDDIVSEEGMPAYPSKPYPTNLPCIGLNHNAEVRMIWRGASVPIGTYKFKCDVPPPDEAEGEITICNINGLSCPSNGEANPGDTIPVTAEMKNVGTKKGKFMFYVLDQDGNELSKAGGIGYKDVEAGETWKVTPESWDDLDFDMPTKSIIEGQLKLARLE